MSFDSPIYAPGSGRARPARAPGRAEGAEEALPALGADDTDLELRIRIHAPTLKRVLVWGFLIVSLAGLGAEFVDELPVEDPLDLVHFFGLSYEENLPTWYTSVLLFSSAVALLFITIEKRRRADPFLENWWTLALVFVLISLDEIAQYHEGLSNHFDYDGVLYFGWVIPAGIFVTGFAITYLGFLRALPRRVAVRMTVAGAIYVFGALVMELPLGWWTDQMGRRNLTYGLIDWVEESLEIVGVSVFLYTLLEYLSTLWREEPTGADALVGPAARLEDSVA